MNEQTYYINVSYEEYEKWVLGMTTNGVFITPQWIMENIPTPCSIIESSWSNGVLQVKARVRSI